MYPSDAGAEGRRDGILQEFEKTYTFDIPLSKPLTLLPSSNLPSPTPSIYNYSKAHTSARLPAPYT